MGSHCVCWQGLAYRHCETDSSSQSGGRFQNPSSRYIQTRENWLAGWLSGWLANWLNLLQFPCHLIIKCFRYHEPSSNSQSTSSNLLGLITFIQYLINISSEFDQTDSKSWKYIFTAPLCKRNTIHYNTLLMNNATVIKCNSWHSQDGTEGCHGCTVLKVRGVGTKGSKHLWTTSYRLYLHI